jgi:hypothetical protein
MTLVQDTHASIHAELQELKQKLSIHRALTAATGCAVTELVVVKAHSCDYVQQVVITWW